MLVVGPEVLISYNKQYMQAPVLDSGAVLTNTNTFVVTSDLKHVVTANNLYGVNWSISLLIINQQG